MDPVLPVSLDGSASPSSAKRPRLNHQKAGATFTARPVKSYGTLEIQHSRPHSPTCNAAAISREDALGQTCKGAADLERQVIKDDTPGGNIAKASTRMVLMGTDVTSSRVAAPVRGYFMEALAPGATAIEIPTR